MAFNSLEQLRTWHAAAHSKNRSQTAVHSWRSRECVALDACAQLLMIIDAQATVLQVHQSMLQPGIEYVRAHRDAQFQSEQLDGVIPDEEAEVRQQIDDMDTWLQAAQLLVRGGL